ncbi:glycosyltransferase family 39 protein [Bombella sp. TMW 2.2559]|uniref:Glycosyltransferase family 39 protein n=1 Tax=Bombella dulcis TaxID=2967339 RepID=A0ABT3WBC7_9PROT|nr:glycosyltransferase family 39 protein [Bombella dulcis]MCX5616390.1 glycosyltransferase family 39 protein [Bombella dulcis]
MILSFRHYALLAVLAFLLVLPGRISLPPLDRDEPRYMQATAQMLSSGNFLDIRFQDQPRYLQPAGIYWLEAGAVKAAEIVTQDSSLLHKSWPYRIPSLLASTLSIILTAWIGARLFGGAAGLLAAGLLLVAPLFAAESRMATIDSVLLLDILCLQALLLRHFDDMRKGRATPCRYSILYWCALGGGLMLKGPVVLIPALGTLATLCICLRSISLLRQLRSSGGWLLSLLIVLPWCLGITLISHGEFFRRAVGHNLLGKITHAQETHGFPPGYYLLLFLPAFWPGAFSAVRSLPLLWQRRMTPEVLFLLCWIIPHWIIFECLATKLPHYVLPTYPAIAILTAASLSRWSITPLRSLWARLGIGLYAVLWIMAGLAFCTAGPILLYRMEGHFFANALLPVGGSLPLLLLAGWLFWKRKGRDGVFCAIGAALLTEMGIFLCVIPHLASIQLSPRIATSFEQMRPCHDSVLISPSYREPSLIFLTGGTTRLLSHIQAARSLHDHARCDLALVDQKDDATFRKELTRLGTESILYDQFEGLNYSNGHHLHLRLYASSTAPAP